MSLKRERERTTGYSILAIRPCLDWNLVACVERGPKVPQTRSNGSAARWGYLVCGKLCVRFWLFGQRNGRTGAGESARRGVGRYLRRARAYFSPIQARAVGTGGLGWASRAVDSDAQMEATARADASSRVHVDVRVKDLVARKRILQRWQFVISATFLGGDGGERKATGTDVEERLARCYVADRLDALGMFSALFL